MRRNKYGAKKVHTIYGDFDSKQEEKRFIVLKELEQQGKIQNLRRQVPYELIPSQYIDGKCVERSCKYVADFVYIEDGKEVVEDSKGFKTDTYKLKRKLMLYIHGIRIKETK